MMKPFFDMPSFFSIPKGSTPNRYSPHYAGKRGIASERNRRKIASGQIPPSQVLRGRKAA